MLRAMSGSGHKARAWSRQNKNGFLDRKPSIYLVGAARFELATTCTPCRYATRLRYAPRRRILTLKLIQNGAQLALDRRHIDAVGPSRAAVARGEVGLFVVREGIVEPVA